MRHANIYWDMKDRTVSSLSFFENVYLIGQQMGGMYITQRERDVNEFRHVLITQTDRWIDPDD